MFIGTIFFSLLCFAQTVTGRWLKSLRKSFQDKLAHANSTAEESISNITTVRSFSNEHKMTGIYDVEIEKSYKLGRRISFLSGTFVGIMTFLVFCASALVLWYGGYLVYHREIAPGTLISLMLYTLNLAMSFAFLSNLYGEFMQVYAVDIIQWHMMAKCTVMFILKYDVVLISLHFA